MIWEGDDAGANSKDHARMNLTMRPLMSVRIDRRFYPLARIIGIELLFHSHSLLHLSTHLQIFRCHGNHDRFLLFSINVLYDPI